LDADIELLNGMLPKFWWFRDTHYVARDKLRIVASVMAREDCGGEVGAYFNGSRMSNVARSTSDYADRTFWFVPQEFRFGLTLEQPVSAATDPFVVTVSPFGDVPEWRSGQYISWDKREPTPPLANIERVSGKGATAYNYHNNGLTDFLRFSEIARLNGIDIGAPGTSIIDWGCGCGRLTRHLIEAAADPSNVHGIDIDPDNIGWCRRNLPTGSFKHVGLYPPTEFARESIDLIIANSVLSHLKIDAMHAWLDEVARLLKPGGLALLSYHGEFSLATLASRSMGFVKKTLDTGFNSSLGANELREFIPDPEYYRQTYMTDAGAARIFREHLKLEGVKVGMVSRCQNVAILRK
jgi:2-polyprenyl-3-methyl-5-hydroxy-6-metoxy-1,4-benzoquinol methylase